MKRKRYTEEQIIGILKEHEAPRTWRVDTAYRSSRFIAGRGYGGMEVSDAKRLKELEDENRRLKRMVADLSLDKQMLQDVLSRKW